MTQTDPLITRIKDHLDQVEGVSPPPDLEGHVLAHVAAGGHARKEGPATKQADAPRWYQSRTMKGVLAIPAALAAVLIISFAVPAFQPHSQNVFSNISAGLGSGGVPTTAANSGSSNPGSNASEPVANQSTASTSKTKLSVVSGNLPANVARGVSAGYVIPNGTYETSFDKLTELAYADGGYLQSSQTYHNSKGRVDRGSMVFEIPSTKWDVFLASIPSNFTESYLNYSSTSYSSQVNTDEDALKADQSQLLVDQQDLAATTNPTTQAQLQQDILQLEAEITTEQQNLSSISTTVSYVSATIWMQEANAVAAKPGPLSQAISRGLTNDANVLSFILLVILSIWIPVLLVGIVLFFARMPIRSAWRRMFPAPILPDDTE